MLHCPGEQRSEWKQFRNILDTEALVHFAHPGGRGAKALNTWRVRVMAEHDKKSQEKGLLEARRALLEA